MSLQDAIRTFPFADDCSTPPLIYGTGRLFFANQAGTVEEDAGNFSLVDLSTEAESFRVFFPGDEVPSSVAATSAVVAECVGDSFSIRNLSRLMNEPIANNADGQAINLTTVRDQDLRRITFVKDLTDQCFGPECSAMELILWRAYIDAPWVLSFDPEAALQHTFRIVAVHDSIAHPAAPFGVLQFVCPVGAS